MTPLRLLPRLMRVAATLLKYDLDDLVDEAHLFRPLKLVRPLFPSAPADVRARVSAVRSARRCWTQSR